MKKTRAGQNTPKKPKNSGKIEKIYYVVIGLLIVILGGLVIFIFSNRDDALTEGDQDATPDSELITDNGEEDDTEEEPEEDTETPAEDEETEEETEEPVEEPEEDTESEETDEDAETDADTDSETDTEEEAETEDEPEEEVDETDEAAEEDTTDEDEADDADINAEAPLDESYNINFGEGSSDRNAIASNASAVSGISQGSMITWWVGNNGPGRAFTIVSDSGRNTVYRVELQYGEGSWHVTSAQELDGVPAEYR